MTRRDQIDLLQRALDDPELNPMEIPSDLSDAQKALINKLVVIEANKLADQLLAETTPQGWAGVQVARTPLARLQKPAEKRYQPRGDPEMPHQVSQPPDTPKPAQIARERARADPDPGGTP